MPAPLKLTIVLLLFACREVFAQAPSQVVEIKQFSDQGILLDKGWKFQAGDNPEKARSDWDDSKWKNINLSNSNSYLSELKKQNIGWFRLHILLDSSLLKQSLALQLPQLGASEIYVNGRLFQRFGSIKKPFHYKSFNPVYTPYLLPFSAKKQYVIAIRFASRVPTLTWLFTSTTKSPLTVTINSWNNALHTFVKNKEEAQMPVGFSYMFLTLALLFILLYIFFPKEKINLLFGGVSLGMVTRTIIQYQLSYGNLDIVEFGIFTYLRELNDIVEGILIISIIAQAVLNKITFYHWLLFCAIGINHLIFLFFGPVSLHQLVDFTLRLLVILCFFHLSILGYRSKNYIIGTVALNAGILNIFLLLIFYSRLNLNYSNIHFFFLSNFFMITLYVSINFARKNKNLERQLIEIKELSAENFKKEQEKQQILSVQKETLEKQVQERTAALSQSLIELKATQSQLIQREKMASLGELTAGIAHEIQNPLNFVNNFSEVSTELVEELKEGPLQKLPSDEKVYAGEIIQDLSQNLQKINHHGKRAEEIVKGMLQHSRSNSGEKQLTDINALAEEYLRLAYHGLRDKDKEFNASLITTFDTNIGKVEVVPQELSRVLLNLFNNAFYATQQKKALLNGQYQPEVKVSTGQQNGHVEIKVRDNGNGIPDKIKSKIFQPFFTTKPPGQGTGLGLLLSYDIIKSHDGDLKVESKVDEYSEFIIKLPKPYNSTNQLLKLQILLF